MTSISHAQFAMRGADIRPMAFYLDSYDYVAFRKLLLDPLGPGGSGRYVAKHFDHRIDAQSMRMRSRRHRPPR